MCLYHRWGGGGTDDVCLLPPPIFGSSTQTPFTVCHEIMPSCGLVPPPIPPPTPKKQQQQQQQKKSSYIVEGWERGCMLAYSSDTSFFTLAPIIFIVGVNNYGRHVGLESYFSQNRNTYFQSCKCMTE